MIQWEYYVYVADPSHNVYEVCKYLDKIGVDGWQLVSESNDTFWFIRSKSPGHVIYRKGQLPERVA